MIDIEPVYSWNHITYFCDRLKELALFVPDMVSPIIPKEDGVKVMKKEPEMKCIDSRGKNRGQVDQIISTQYLVWTNSLLQLHPMPTHILLNWVSQQKQAS